MNFLKENTQDTARTILQAYASGFFPIALNKNDYHIYWLNPGLRGILPLEGFHVPRSLMRILKKNLFDVRCDTAFTDVIKGCAEYTPKRANTWISNQILQIYEELFLQGYAHSIEVWQEGTLVGGLYGIAIGAAFFGESMFSRTQGTSKIALCHIVARLKIARYCLFDIQFVTPHLARFGAIVVPRRDYLDLLTEALSHQCLPLCKELSVPIFELL